MGNNGRRQKVLYLRATRHGSRGGRMAPREEPHPAAAVGPAGPAGPTKFLAVPGALSLHNLAEVISEAFNLAFTPSYRFCFDSADPDRTTVLHPRTTETIEAFDRPGREVLFLCRGEIHQDEIRIVVTLVDEEEAPRL